MQEFCIRADFREHCHAGNRKVEKRMRNDDQLIVEPILV